MTFKDANILRHAFLELFHQQGFTHFVTLGFHRDISDLYGAASTVYRFQARLDRDLLGSRWHKLPPHMRTLMFCIPERGSLRADKRRTAPTSGETEVEGLHYHVLMRVPPTTRRDLTLGVLGREIFRHWKAVTPQGSVDVQGIHTVLGVGVYVTKQMVDNSLFINHAFFLPQTRSLYARTNGASHVA